MDTSLAVKNMRRQSWALMIQMQARSGLTVREWCAENGITPKTFYYRRREVRAMLLQATQESTFAELVPPTSVLSVQEKERSVSEPLAFTPQLVVSVGGAMVGINQNTPRQLIADTLEVLRNA
ncbi:MAG: hypothetical protein IJW67_02810 [Blautia sp.]|nr:hypothetical protein [Blautia sp.]